MYEKTRKNGAIEKRKQTMGVAVKSDRHCTISESIMQLCKEVKSMRKGRIWYIFVG